MQDSPVDELAQYRASSRLFARIHEHRLTGRVPPGDAAGSSHSKYFHWPRATGRQPNLDDDMDDHERQQIRVERVRRFSFERGD